LCPSAGPQVPVSRGAPGRARRLPGYGAPGGPRGLLPRGSHGLRRSLTVAVPGAARVLLGPKFARYRGPRPSHRSGGQQLTAVATGVGTAVTTAVRTAVSTAVATAAATAVTTALSIAERCRGIRRKGRIARRAARAGSQGPVTLLSRAGRSLPPPGRAWPRPHSPFGPGAAHRHPDDSTSSWPRWKPPRAMMEPKRPSLGREPWRYIRSGSR
jgi:hypothetical protein